MPMMPTLPRCRGAAAETEVLRQAYRDRVAVCVVLNKVAIPVSTNLVSKWILAKELPLL